MNITLEMASAIRSRCGCWGFCIEVGGMGEMGMVGAALYQGVLQKVWFPFGKYLTNGIKKYITQKLCVGHIIFV